jgi:hypothetical protein
MSGALKYVQDVRRALRPYSTKAERDGGVPKAADVESGRARTSLPSAFNLSRLVQTFSPQPPTPQTLHVAMKLKRAKVCQCLCPPCSLSTNSVSRHTKSFSTSTNSTSASANPIKSCSTRRSSKMPTDSRLTWSRDSKKCSAGK